MGVVTARLVFLAFLGLTGAIIYNALYLQEHGPRGAPSVGVASAAHKVAGDSQTVPVRPRDESSNLEVPPMPEQDAAVTEQAKVSAGSASGGMPGAASSTSESQLVVRAVQRELAARGYDVGMVDGDLSQQTRVAISDFQGREGLAVTGLPSDELLRQILLGDSIAPAVATGSVATDSIAANAAEGDTIKDVQRILADLGYAPGPIDGAWGENTASAISTFQRDRNLAETGRITPELLAELERVSGRDLTKTAAHP
jgi:peptidoglycan hydrolase-like protein with peptidoglycan-binding domain